MNTTDLERFKRIPRNDILIYLHQNTLLGNNIKIRDIYDRINKPTNIFCYIIDDLLRLSLIECKNYSSLTNDFNCFFPESINNVEIKLTTKGEDYVESRLFGFNLNKYGENDSTNMIKIGNLSGRIDLLFSQSYEEFKNTFSLLNIGHVDAYYLLTGITHKQNSEKKVFISYSWDSEKHKEWITKLANDLSVYFHVEYDNNLKIAMSPNNYMKQNILSSDFVLIVFTPNYLKKIKDKSDSGAKFEYSIIENDLFRKISFGKYIPILKEGNINESIPETMSDSIYVDFTSENLYKDKLKDLIEKIKQ